MSLRKCYHVFPQIVNYVKSNKTLLCRPVLIHINQNYLTSANYHKTGIRLSSTRSGLNKTAKNVKEVYYGVLTPQIRAVKVNMNQMY